MNEIFQHCENSVSTKQSKITGSKINEKQYVLRPPFGIDDPCHMLARFKASRQNASTSEDWSWSRRKRVIPRQYEVNPNMKTMYQYHYNDTGDDRLGYCDQRSIEALHQQFKRSQQRQKNLRELFHLRMPEAPPRKYRSDYSKRISEYSAEISYVASKFTSNKIHDHTKCGRLPKHCVHYIEF